MLILDASLWQLVIHLLHLKCDHKKRDNIWRKTLEDKGLKNSQTKTKYMEYKFSDNENEDMI